MKISTIANNKYKVLSLITILLGNILSKIYSPIVVPSFREVIEALITIFTEKKYLLEILLTVKRLFIALTISISLGMLLGLAAGFSKIIKGLVMPYINIMQSVPPISWLVLALIWFGLNGKASIFIAVIATLPLVMINIIEGVSNIDANLVEMGYMYNFSKKKMITKIVVPSIMPYFEAGLKIAIGNGCKVIVMGEVLSTSTGIGGQLTNARLNIETQFIFAWTIVIILLFYINNKLISYIFHKKIKGDRYAHKDAKLK